MISFESAAEMLDTFGLGQGGAQYRRLIESFKRIFGATIFFGTDCQRERARVFHQSRFNFMSEARIWYARDVEQPTLPGDCRNTIVLSPEFFCEILEHPIPTDLAAAKALSCAPAALDLFTWLSYRCFLVNGREMATLRGVRPGKSVGQSRLFPPRKFREKLEGWLNSFGPMWPECPARVVDGGSHLLIEKAVAVLPEGTI